MMAEEVFMSTDNFGDLYIIDVFLTYMYPRCFVCQDKFDTKYLFYEIDDDDINCIWNVVKITKKDYFLICDKKKPIQYCFKNSRKLDRFLFIKNYLEDTITISAMTDDQLNFLPTDDVYSEKVIHDNIASKTLLESREKFASILDFRFYPESDRHSLPSNYLYELINNVKSVFKTFFNNKREEPIDACTVAGSCIVRFQFPDMMNLFNESSASNELEVFSKVLSTSSILDSAQFVEVKKDFVLKYTSLLNTMKKIGGNVQISSASPNKSDASFIELKSCEIQSRHSEAKNIFEIREEFIEKQGKLVAFDSTKRKFTLLIDGETLEGEIDKKWDELDAVRSVNSFYRAQIKMTTKFDADNFVMKKTYLLIDLNHLES